MKHRNCLNPEVTAVVVFIVLSAFLAAEQKASIVSVTVDPRVELVSIIFRLAGNPEYSQGSVPAYNREIDGHFARFGKHPAVRLAKKLRETRGIGFDAPMAIAMHMSDTDSMAERIPLSPKPDSLDERWTPESAREFLRLAKAFAKESGFGDFFLRHQDLYRLAVERMQAVQEKHGHLEWFDAFFGEKKRGDFRVILGLVNGGANYGVRIRLTSKSEELYSIIGVWETDAQGQPVIPDGIIPTVVHEFTHSYANALVDRFADQLRSAGEKIFPVVAKEMQKQAYGDWKTMMCESLIRACTLRYILAYDGGESMEKAAKIEEGRSFYWAGELARLLGEYDTRVKRYRGLDEFFPRIVAFFNDYARDIDSKLAAVKAGKEKRMQEIRDKGPKIVSMVPANGAQDVDPDLSAIVVTFDRPMRNGSWSVMQLGDGTHFPPCTGPVHYDAQCRVFTIPVRLKPDWEYHFGLNREQKLSFVSSEGVPLYPVEIRFRTRKK